MMEFAADAGYLELWVSGAEADLQREGYLSFSWHRNNTTGQYFTLVQPYLLGQYDTGTLARKVVDVAF